MSCLIFRFCFCSFFLTAFFLLKYGITALHIAAEKGFEQIVKILVEHGSNLHLQEQVLIFFFFWFWFWFFVFFLISLFVDCDFIVGFVSCWLWMVVCYLILFLFFFLTTFFLLKNGWTALHLAVFKGSEQIVKILVEHGANVHLQDSVFWFWFWFLCFFFWFLYLLIVILLLGLFHVDCEWLCVIWFCFYSFF